jgi:hypothetical protein
MKKITTNDLKKGMYIFAIDKYGNKFKGIITRITGLDNQYIILKTGFRFLHL